MKTTLKHFITAGIIILSIIGFVLLIIGIIKLPYQISRFYNYLALQHGWKMIIESDMNINGAFVMICFVLIVAIIFPIYCAIHQSVDESGMIDKIKLPKITVKKKYKKSNQNGELSVCENIYSEVIK